MITIGEIFSVFKEFLPLFTACGVTVSAAGLVPRLGPGRAIWIALYSRFAVKPKRVSLRAEEIRLLKTRIAWENSGQEYFVVTGEKGVGKTCLVKTVTSKTPGVISVKVQATHSEDTIIRNTLQILTRIQFDFIPPFHSAHRVILWYRLLTLGSSPIVVLNTTERLVGEKFAGLTGAVRTLVDDYRLRVIVDASPNSLDESLLRTGRQRSFEIKPMTKEMVWQIDQLQDLFKYTKEAGLDDIVFAVLGGIPCKYEELWGNASIALKNGENPRQVIGFHLCAEIFSAIKQVVNSKMRTPDMKEIIKLFENERKWIVVDTMLQMNLKRPSPDRIFREANRDGMPVLIPASNAIGIVLNHSLSVEPSLNQLEQLLRNDGV